MARAADAKNGAIQVATGDPRDTNMDPWLFGLIEVRNPAKSWDLKSATTNTGTLSTKSPRCLFGYLEAPLALRSNMKPDHPVPWKSAQSGALWFSVTELVSWQIRGNKGTSDGNPDVPSLTFRGLVVPQSSNQPDQGFQDSANKVLESKEILH